MPERATNAGNYIRQWRERRGLSLEALAADVDMTHASLSRIERGKQALKQETLNNIAKRLGCLPTDLLMRAPDDPEGIWALWDRATPEQRRQLVRLAKALIAAE